MAGQVRIVIAEKEWLADLANNYWEQVQGLGGLSGIPAGTAMLFDMGYEQTISVTTEPMLFALDIAFLSEALEVTEVYQNVAPGYHVNSIVPARYFLEVNAGELKELATGEFATVEILTLQTSNTETNWMSTLFSLVGLAVVGLLLTELSKSITSETSIKTKTISYLAIPGKNKGSACCSNKSCDKCEKVSPRDYALLSWVGAPIPDYSFSIEAAATERKIDEVLKRLKEGVSGIQDSDNFRQFLLTMSKFHDYSIGNLILIMLQKPDATHVAGFTTWKNLGRWVKQGAKGIAILAPCMPSKNKKSETVVEPDTTDQSGAESEQIVEIRPVYFKVVYVFDVSQTEGKPLPEFEVPVLTGEANEGLFENMLSLAKDQELNVSFESKPEQDPSIKGMYYSKNIWVRPEESRAQQLKTIIHEMAHYYSENVFRIPRRDAETIAESVAFTVGAHYGFDTGTRSFPYVALWSQDKKVLEANLASIRNVSSKIFEALDKIQNHLPGVV